MAAQDITLLIYNLALLPVIFFSVLFILLAFINLFWEGKKKKYKKFDLLPFISVQIPTYNDPIAERCVKKCMEFDYPKDRYEIIIVDDSTNVQTQELFKGYALKNPDLIKYVHRDNRSHFKPGALMNAMKETKGEIIVLFDSDWIPNKDFLIRIVEPFSDPKVAIVQSRQGFYNKDTNLITRFASYLLMVYHTIVMPINNRLNCVFFCGTAGAIRKSAFEKVGGWNTKSITEDSELSVRILAKGYKSVYLTMETPSEVPDTFESFIKQQMRWSYGNIRVFFDNFNQIWLKKGLKLKQRIMITYITMATISAPFVLIMTIAGSAGWFLGEPTLFQFSDVVKLILTFVYTSGFLIIGAITLYRHKILKEFPKMALTAFTIGLILSVATTVAFIKATTNKKLHWYCTPKVDNDKII